MTDKPAPNVAIVSGGMDSTTLAYLYAIDHGAPLHMLSFDYGQRHRRELDYARKTAARLGVQEHRVLTIPLGDLGGSALTDDAIAVPEGHYADENMRQTVVPNRNMILLAFGIAYAVRVGARRVGTAVHAGDHPVYPDCRPDFALALTLAARIGNESFIEPDFRIDTPFVHSTKTDIAIIGHRLGVDWTETWSCYQGGERHCGRCGTCVERREAFSLAGLADPTDYEPRYE